MKPDYTKDIISYAFFGIEENVDSEETVEVSLRDLMKVNAVLEELNRFFHQPLHHQSIEDVHEYLGTFEDPRAYRLLKIAYYELMQKMLPQKIDDLFDEGIFERPVAPYYFEEKSCQKE